MIMPSRFWLLPSRFVFRFTFEGELELRIKKPEA